MKPHFERSDWRLVLYFVLQSIGDDWLGEPGPAGRRTQKV